MAKIIDSIHEASKDPRRAQEIASKSSIALFVDAVVLAALILGALWLLKSASEVFTGEVTSAIEAFVVFLFIVVIGGGLFISVRVLLHTYLICIHAVNQLKENRGLKKAKSESAFRSLMTTVVKDKKGLEDALVELLRQPEKSSDVVIVYIALYKLMAIRDNQSAFIKAYPIGDCPVKKSEFARLKDEISKSINRKMEDRDSKQDIYIEKYKKIKLELSQYCKK